MAEERSQLLAVLAAVLVPGSLALQWVASSSCIILHSSNIVFILFLGFLQSIVFLDLRFDFYLYILTISLFFSESILPFGRRVISMNARWLILILKTKFVYIPLLMDTMTTLLALHTFKLWLLLSVSFTSHVVIALG